MAQALGRKGDGLVVQHELYRHFDKLDRLLYVGRSLSTILRLVGHRNSSAWAGEIIKITIERFFTYADVIAAERLAILTESPLHNKAHIKRLRIPNSRTERLNALKVRAVQKPGLYHDAGGLYLQVTGGKNQPPAKSWLYRFSKNGKTRQMGLGSIKNVSLAEARQLMADARKLLAAGIDPIEQRRSQEPTPCLPHVTNERPEPARDDQRQNF